MKVAVRGRRGMLRDLVEHVVSGGDRTDGRHEHHDVTVVVLVEPKDCDWSSQSPAERYIVLRSELDGGVMIEDLRRGADAVFGPDVSAEEIGRAVEVVASGGCWLPPEVARHAVDALRRAGNEPQPVGLTPRELDILRCAAEGASIKQTARRLGIAPKTVENLQGRMFRKLGVRNRAQAVAWAHTAGLLDPGNP